MTLNRENVHLVFAALAFAAVAVAWAAPSGAEAAAQTAAADGGDAARGADVYRARCTGCHSLDANRIGPRHRGVFGRVAGSLDDFRYSPALQASDLVWDAESLDLWLTNPQALIPGQRMGFRLGDAAARRDVIAFLKQESSQ